MKANAKRFEIPSPFALAIGLTFVTFILTWIFTDSESSESPRLFELANYWSMGFWELLEFSMQMSLILILGYALAITPIANKITSRLISRCNNTQSSVLVVALGALICAWLNWGLGLIVGAVLARKVAEKAQRENFPINYPLIGAAGYSGLMIWHGGFSGSSTLSIAEGNHFLADKIGVIDIGQTILSDMNLWLSISLLLIIPLFLFWQSTLKPEKENIPNFENSSFDEIKFSDESKWDRHKWLGSIFGALLLLAAISHLIYSQSSAISQFNINFVNFLFFGLGMLFHGSLAGFVKAIERAVGASAGIIIQFPLYAGIMGLMKYSGLAADFAMQLSSISTSDTFPILAFFSAAITNLFVPSGGGQWAVQGPVLMDTAKELGVPIWKTVMAFAYGDQLTNMLQPFWALPLLGITQLKAKEILPYTINLFLLGLVIFTAFLVLF
jgi:short-chain fatty acids transporter